MSSKQALSQYMNKIWMAKSIKPKMFWKGNNYLKGNCPKNKTDK